MDVRQLADKLAATGVIRQRELDDLPTTASDADPMDGFLRRLLQLGRLTNFQYDVIRKMGLLGVDELLLGDYVLLDLIGEGGMGRVFKARHRHLNRLEAIKVLTPKATEADDAIQRFRREVRTAAHLVHPNIVRAHHAGEIRGIHFLAMEFIDGENLDALVRRSGPLSVDDAVRCLADAAMGLQYAHAQKVIHRDIKPANLIRDLAGRTKILDLGIARILEPETIWNETDQLTSDREILGTFVYMAPEQLQNSHIADERSDIYSLGCTLYFLLTGEPIFDVQSLTDVLKAHGAVPIPSLCHVRAAVPEYLDRIFRKMVAPDPSQRYLSVSELLDELQEQPEGIPTGSVPLVTNPIPGDRENEYLSAFLGSTRMHRIVRPRLFAGVACPWDKPLPSYDYFDILKRLCYAPGIAGELEMSLTRRRLRQIEDSGDRYDIVLLVAHGKWDVGHHYSLFVPRDESDRFSEEFGRQDLRDLLTAVGASMVVLVSCQERETYGQAELGDLLLHSVPNLDAVITFRTKVLFDTARGFLAGLCESLTEGGVSSLTEALVKSRRAIPSAYSTLPGTPRFDFTAATLHLRREVALAQPPEPGFVLLSGSYQDVSLGTLHVRLLERAIDAWQQQCAPVTGDVTTARTTLADLRNATTRCRNPDRFRHVRRDSSDIDIGRYPVTNREYLVFLGDSNTDRRKRLPSSDVDIEDPRHAWLPVTGISLEDALEYATWCGCGNNQHRYRLLTYSEWVVAAFVDENGKGSLYPWGDVWYDWDDEHHPHQARAESESLVPVYESYGSNTGIHGMVGNCWELCHTFRDGQHSLFSCGGGFRSPRWQCTMFGCHPEDCTDIRRKLGSDVGFRLVREPV